MTRRNGRNIKTANTQNTTPHPTGTNRATKPPYKMLVGYGTTDPLIATGPPHNTTINEKIPIINGNVVEHKKVNFI